MGMIDHIIPPNDRTEEEYQRMQDTYDKIRVLEPLISSDMNDIAKELGTSFDGMEYSVKTASSISDKLKRMQKNYVEQYSKTGLSHPFSEADILAKMKDIVRYTEICDHEEIFNVAKDTIASLSDRGYVISGIKNYFKSPYPNTGYMGLHLNFISPYGQEIELQIHSPESFKAKQDGHHLYEFIRSHQVPEKDEYQERIREIHKSIPKPQGYDTLDTWPKTRKDKQRIVSENTRIQTELKKSMNVLIEKSSCNHVNSMVYKISKNGEPLFHGFENIGSDGSVFFYQYNEKTEEGSVGSLTPGGNASKEYSAKNIEFTVEETLQMALDREITHEKWIQEHFRDGELGEDRSFMENMFEEHEKSLEEILEHMKTHDKDTTKDIEFSFGNEHRGQER